MEPGGNREEARAPGGPAPGSPGRKRPPRARESAAGSARVESWLPSRRPRMRAAPRSRGGKRRSPTPDGGPLWAEMKTTRRSGDAPRVYRERSELYRAPLPDCNRASRALRIARRGRGGGRCRGSAPGRAALGLRRPAPVTGRARNPAPGQERDPLRRARGAARKPAQRTREPQRRREPQQQNQRTPQHDRGAQRTHQQREHQKRREPAACALPAIAARTPQLDGFQAHDAHTTPSPAA